MIDPAVVAALLVVSNLLLAWMVSGAGWTRRSPALGILFWQALTVSIFVSVTLALTLLSAPVVLLIPPVEAVVEACAPSYVEMAMTPLQVIIGLMAAGVLASLIARVALCAIAEIRDVRSCRAMQRSTLDLVSRAHERWPVAVVNHATTAAYCVPGKPGRIVMTAGTFDLLDDDQIRAVIAHERAHLHGRHGWVLLGAQIFASAFPFMPVMRAARAEIGCLLEMRADEIALRSSSPRAMAQALVHLSGSPTPAGSLGAGGPTAARLHRLVAPGTDVGRCQRASIQALIVLVALAPLLAFAGPWGHLLLAYCSFQAF